MLLHCVGAEDRFKTHVQNVLSSRKVFIVFIEREPSFLNSIVWEANANPVLKWHIREEKSALWHWQQSCLSIP